MMTVAERLVCERGGSCEIRQVVAMMEVMTSERGNAQRRRLPQGARRSGLGLERCWTPSAVERRRWQAASPGTSDKAVCSMMSAASRVDSSGSDNNNSRLTNYVVIHHIPGVIKDL